jgi:hypothetical protein
MLAPSSPAGVDVAGDQVELLGRDQRAHLGGLVEPVAELDLAGLLGDTLDDLVVHRLLDVEP